VLLLAAGYLLVMYVKTDLSFGDILILSVSFSVISFITIQIFFRGQSKEPESQTLFSLVALGLKFLLEIVFALLWFIVAKKNSLPSVLMFFVLYLTLSLFTIWTVVKTLKNKALLNRN
jgi:hypothetical protein